MGNTPLSTNVYVTDNAYDTPTLIGWAAEALSRMTTSMDTLLAGGRADIVFATPKQIKALGGVWGFTNTSTRQSHVNNSLTKAQTEYTVLHELSHIVDPDTLNHTSRAAIAGLMHPSVNTATSGFWGNGTAQNAPAECYANTFPQAFTDLGDVAGSYYTRTINSSDFGTYRTDITGSGVPTSLSLASIANSGASNVKYSGTPTGLTVGDWIQIDTGSNAEVTQITSLGTSGSGGTGIGVSPALGFTHQAGAAIVETSAPSVGSGTGATGFGVYSLTVHGVQYIGQVPSSSIRIEESGSDAIATFEFLNEIEDPDSDLQIAGVGNGYDVPAGTEFPDDQVILSRVDTGWRVFGGVLTGATRAHMAGPGISQAIRCVSYDSWLDRRSIPAWWTTGSGAQSGTKISDDRLIVENIILQDSAGKVGGGVGLIANDTYVKSTNVAMPKLNLPDGTLRDHIRAVADAAATAADPTPRRAYVDFFKRVHYFKGNEGNPAPYRIGDAVYASTVQATAGLVSYWPLNEVGGSSWYDAKGGHHFAISGFRVVGITAGVVNQPQTAATYFAGATSGLASSAALHPGNTFSVELWFQRNKTGTEQVLLDAGTADYQIEFDSGDHIKVLKKGTGADFTTTATFTDTNWHHLVVTHSGSATHVYVDGNDKAGTAALKSLAPSTNNLFVGEQSDGTLKFNGSLQHLAFYSVALAGATVTAHYNDGITLVPDYIEFDTDYNTAVSSVYIRGANPAGTGWSTFNGVRSPYGANAIIDRQDSDAAATKAAIETAFLKRDGATVQGGYFEITGYDGWRAGQTVSVDDAGLSVLGSWEIKYIQGDVQQEGSGLITWQVHFGTMPWRGTFDIRRKNRRRSNN